VKLFNQPDYLWPNAAILADNNTSPGYLNCKEAWRRAHSRTGLAKTIKFIATNHADSLSSHVTKLRNEGQEVMEHHRWDGENENLTMPYGTPPVPQK
jgi:hypothetical protein